MVFNRDGLPEKDLLNRKQFADEIATGLLESFENGSDSFVFGLNGKWGSGKSTLLSFIRDSIERHNKSNEYILVEFNPWMFSNRDELLSAFLEQLLSQIKPKHKKIREALSTLLNASKYFGWVKYVNSSLGEIQKEATKALSEVVANGNIPKLKSQIDKLLVDENIRLIAFIDDLDRLTPNEVVEMFQIVKLNASFKNSIFVISYDKEIVQEIIKEHYGINGEKYLEKIIQVDYRIPDIHGKVIEEIFLIKLSEFLERYEVSWDVNEIKSIWVVRRMKYYFNTLRDIYRFFNALKLRYPAIRNDVNLYQFLVIEAIRIFDYQTYELIQKHYKKGVQFGPNTMSSRIKDNLENENTTYLYLYLFETPSLAKFSISEPIYFDRYFALAIGGNDAAREMVRLFVTDDRSREHILEQAISNKTVKSLLSELIGEDLELQALGPLLKWKYNAEDQLFECREIYVDLLLHILDHEDDFVKAFSHFVSILGSQDSNLSYARLYVLYLFNRVANGEETSILRLKERSKVVASFQQQLRKRLEDFLNNHVNQVLVFGSRDSSAVPFRKIFVLEYSRLFPEEYFEKSMKFFQNQGNVLYYLRFFLVNQNEKLTLDEESFIRIMNASLLKEFLGTFSEINKSGLTKDDIIYFIEFEKIKHKVTSLLD